MEISRVENTIVEWTLNEVSQYRATIITLDNLNLTIERIRIALDEAIEIRDIIKEEK